MLHHAAPRSKAKLRSPPPFLHRSPELPVGIRRTGSCLTSEGVEGGEGPELLVGRVLGSLSSLMRRHGFDPPPKIFFSGRGDFSPRS